MCVYICICTYVYEIKQDKVNKSVLYINFIKHCTSNIPFHIFLIIHPVNQSGLYLNCCL